MPSKNTLTDALENSEKENTAKNKDTETQKQSQYLPPSRQGKKQIAGYFHKNVHHQLKLLSLEEDKSIQVLLEESLNHLFSFYEKPPIA